MQCLITNTLQHWSEQNAFLIAQSCYAKQADSIAVSHHQCTTALVKTKCLPHCPELLCKTGRQQAVIANRPLGICSSYRCAMTQFQCTAALVRTTCISHCLELLCKTGCQQACVIANRPLGICSSYRCAMTQFQCTVVLVKTK